MRPVRFWTDVSPAWGLRIASTSCVARVDRLRDMDAELSRLEREKAERDERQAAEAHRARLKAGQ